MVCCVAAAACLAEPAGTLSLISADTFIVSKGIFSSDSDPDSGQLTIRCDLHLKHILESKECLDLGSIYLNSVLHIYVHEIKLNNSNLKCAPIIVC